jgi:hypothetical protein
MNKSRRFGAYLENAKFFGVAVKFLFKLFENNRKKVYFMY